VLRIFAAAAAAFFLAFSLLLPIVPFFVGLKPSGPG
jgi:hypothetical protein